MEVRLPVYSYAMSDPLQLVGDIHQDGFAPRLRHAVNVFGGASALARAIGRSDGAIRKWLRGDSEPNVSDLRAICLASGASVEWLVTGKGDSQLIPGVRESHPRYGELRLVDDNLLEHIITAVDEEARSSSAEIAANKKSAVVTTLYGLSIASGSIDRSAVARLVRLAG